MGLAIALLVVPLGLLVGAVILRNAVALANRRLGPPPEPAYTVEDEDDWGDYPIPGEQPERPEGVIPTPTTGSGMFVILIVAVVNAIVTFVLQMMLEEEPGGRRGRLRGPLDDIVISRLLNLPVSFVLTAALLAALLPTTFSRGCLVALFYFLICLGVAAVLAVPIFLLRVAL